MALALTSSVSRPGLPGADQTAWGLEMSLYMQTVTTIETLATPFKSTRQASTATTQIDRLSRHTTTYNLASTATGVTQIYNNLSRV